MKRLHTRMRPHAPLVAVAAALLLSGAGSALLAGPNRDGALIFHIMPESSNGEGCDFGIRDCAEAVVSVPGNDLHPQLVWVLAAFPTSPAVQGVLFGIDFTTSPPIDWGHCGIHALGTYNWPNAPFEGVGITWNPDDVQEDRLFPVCWFAVYGYDGTSFSIVDFPGQGPPQFGDNSIPSQIDEVEDLGFAGFGVVGYNPCLQGVSFGACCLPAPAGGCIITTESACEVQEGVYLGDDEPCQDYLCSGICCVDNECIQLTFEECEREGGTFLAPARRCGQISCIVEDTSWGIMKHVYR